MDGSGERRRGADSGQSGQRKRDWKNFLCVCHLSISKICMKYSFEWSSFKRHRLYMRGKVSRGWRHKSTGHRATQSSGGLTSRDELVSARSSPQMHKKSAKRKLRQHALVQATYCVFAAYSASVSHLSAISMKKDLCGEVRAASANRMHSAAFSRNC